MYHIHTTKEKVCAITVATAAPLTPISNTVIKKTSKTILISVAAINMYVGVLESPIPRKILVRALYEKVGIHPINISFK